MKKILIMRGYFFPETAASNQMCLELIQTMSEYGYEVDLVCPIPTRGVSIDERKEYSQKKEEIIFPNVTVKRYWLPREKKAIWRRALRYFMQNIYQLFYGLTRHYDILFLYSTPPTNGLVGGILKILKKRPFIYNLHDVFPDSMIEGGIASENSVIFKIGRKIENFTYKHSDRIITISNGIKTNIEKKGVTKGKTVVVYNWIDVDKVKHVERENNQLINEFHISPEKFIVSYAGNIGVAQGVEVIIDAATILEENNDIFFVIIGNGVKEEECKEKARKLNNIAFYPMQSIDRLSEVYSLGDVSIVTCKKGFGKCGMPSKTVSIMSAGTAQVATFDEDSDLAHILRKRNCGICVEPENAVSLAEAIRYLYDRKDKCRVLGTNSRQFVKEELDKQICTEKIMKVIGEFD